MDRIGKYEIKSLLGKGGMGDVYLAYDPAIDREVAIKIITDRGVESAEIRERFAREARAAGRLQHPNITVIHDIGEYEQKPFIVMELLRGEDLDKVIRRMADDPGIINLLEKLNIALQICRGLAYSHQHNIIHRDIKPENIRILEDGGLKIMDFGIAKLLDASITRTGTVLGSPAYMSPEQIQGHTVDHRSDIFSFGVVMYQLFSGSLPFTGESLHAITFSIVQNPVPPLDTPEARRFPELQTMLSGCLEKDPQDRYPSLLELQEDLELLHHRLETDLQQEVQKLIAESRKLLEQKNFDGAGQLVEKARKMSLSSSKFTGLVAAIQKAREEALKVEKQKNLASWLGDGLELLRATKLDELNVLLLRMEALESGDNRINQLRREYQLARQSEEAAAALLQESYLLLDAKRLDEAEASLAEFLKLQPRHADGRALFLKIRTKIKRRSVPETIAAAKELAGRGRIAMSLSLLRKSLKKLPDDPELLEVLHRTTEVAIQNAMVNHTGSGLPDIPVYGSAPGKVAPAAPVAVSLPARTILVDEMGVTIAPAPPGSKKLNWVLWLTGFAVLAAALAGWCLYCF